MKNILFCFLVFVCLSCNKILVSDLDNVPIEECYIDDTCLDTLLPNDYTVEKVLELKMVDNYEIASSRKILVKEDFIYILDGASRKIFVFNENGEMLYALGEIGHAQNELFNSPSDFAVDNGTKDIYVFEDYSGRILKFDISGNFSSVMQKIGLFAFARENDGDFVFAFRHINSAEQLTPEFAIFDAEAKIKKGFMPLERSHSFSTLLPFGSYYNSVSYIPNMSETVYIIDSDTISKGLHFSFNSPYLPQEIIDKVKYESKRELFNHGKSFVHYLDCFSENEYLRYLTYCVSNYRYYYILNKKSGKSYNGPELFDGLFWFTAVSIFDDKVVFLVTQEDYEFCMLRKEHIAKEEWNKVYEATCPAVKKLIAGEIKAPCLIYMTLP